ncbi:MAG: hypothetical protein RL026_755 [Pseudomonadota bacterium]|jgi:flagellar FliL protein
MSKGEPAADAAKSGSKLPLIIGAAALLLGGGAAAAYFMLIRPGDAAHAEAPPEPERLPAVYVPLDPPFVVNFEAGSGARFLQVAVQLMTRDPAVAEMVKAHNPAIRNDLLLLLGNPQLDVISTREGKEALRLQALDVVRKIIAAEGGKGEAVEALYFTSFVTQ